MVGLGQDVEIHFPAQSQIQGKVVRGFPIVLHKQAHVSVAGGGRRRRALRRGAFQGHSDGDVRVVAWSGSGTRRARMAILRGEILGSENCAAAEQIEDHAGAGVLPLSAHTQRMFAPHPAIGIAQLEAVERRLLRNAEVGAILQRGEPNFVTGSQTAGVGGGIVGAKCGNLVEERIHVKSQIVDLCGGEDAVPCGNQ